MKHRCDRVLSTDDLRMSPDTMLIALDRHVLWPYDMAVQGYGHGHKPGMKTHIRIHFPPLKTHGGLPFTGMDLGLITAGAILLLSFGAALRRFARARA